MKRLMMSSIGAGLLALAGCSTIDPLTIPQTDRDKIVYTEKNARPVPAERFKIAVISRTIAHKADTSNDKFAADQIESAVANNFSNLGWFETVDRKNGIAIAGEAMLSGDKNAMSIDKIPGAQMALIAETSIAYVAKQGWKRTSSASKARGVQLDTDFRLIDLDTKETLLVKKVQTIIADSEKGGVQSAITTAANMNAKKFARLVASRYLPEVKVLQTRGNGRYAQVAMGKNYQATPVVKSWKWWPYKYLPLCYVKTTTTPAAGVDFFTIEKEDVVGGKAKYEQSVFAHGTVIRAEDKKAWVEIDDYETAQVHKGHNAKVSEEVEDQAGELE